MRARQLSDLGNVKEASILGYSIASLKRGSMQVVGNVHNIFLGSDCYVGQIMRSNLFSVEREMLPQVRVECRSVITAGFELIGSVNNGG